MNLVIDHVMFPIYFNNPFLEVVESAWKENGEGEVFSQPQNPAFKGVYFKSKSFYVEYLSTVKTEPYWSNAVYVVVPKKYWDFYQNPALCSEHFLVPSFGCGYQLVSPDFPFLSRIISKDISYDGFTLLISEALEKELKNIGGQVWSLPSDGKVKVHEKLLHVHDMAVIDENAQLVAPILQVNPLLREFL